MNLVPVLRTLGNINLEPQGFWNLVSSTSLDNNKSTGDK